MYRLCAYACACASATICIYVRIQVNNFDVSHEFLLRKPVRLETKFFPFENSQFLGFNFYVTNKSDFKLFGPHPHPMRKYPIL